MKRILSVVLIVVISLSNACVVCSAKEPKLDNDFGREIVLYYLENSECSSLTAIYNEYVYTPDFTKSAIKFGLDIGSSPSKAIQYLKDPEAYNNKLDLKYTDAANAIFLKAFGEAEVEFASIGSVELEFISELGSISSSVNKLSKIDYDSLFAGLDNNYNSADTKYIKKAIDEVFPKLKTIYPNLNKGGTLEKIYKKIGDTNVLKTISKFADITDFLYKFMVHIETYETNLKKINYLLEIVDHNSTLGKGLIRMKSQYDEGIIDFFSNPQCVEEIDNLISGEIIKAISVGSYGSLITTTMSIVNVANKIIFDEILKTPDVSTAFTYNILQQYVMYYSDVITSLCGYQNLTDFDALIEVCAQSITYFKLRNSVLDYGRKIAKYNDQYDVSFINNEIEKNDEHVEKFTEYLEELAVLKKNSTEIKKIPGSMTSTSSKKEYTTDENVVINWTESSNATEYVLTIIRDEDNKTVFDGRVTGNSKNIGKLDAGTYRFNMRGYNSTGKGELSKINRFTVKDEMIAPSVVKYSDWSEWSTIPVSATSTMQVESKKQYGYYHYVFDISDGQGAYPVDMKFFNECKIGTASNSRYHEYWSDNKLPVLSGTLTYYSHARKERHTFEKYNNKCCSDNFSFANRANYLYYLGERTVYRYRDIVEEKNENATIILTINSNYAIVCGKKVYNDVAPIIRNARTMLPARFVAENLGASVSWDDESQKVTISGNDGTKIEIYINSTIAYVNGVAKTLDSPAFIMDSRTYTPVRFICDSLGADVQWDDVSRKVTITK